MFEMLSVEAVGDSKLSFAVSDQTLIIKRALNYSKRLDIEKDLGAKVCWEKQLTERIRKINQRFQKGD